MSTKTLKIAIVGTRGVPASYGGFETFAEEVSKEFLALGHEVTVYGRRRFGEVQKSIAEYQGIKIINTATIFHKYLETPLNAFTALFDTLRRDFDVILLCNAANSPFAWLPKLRGRPILINVDGIERKRSKWNSLGRLWYRLGELTSVLFASKIVADADVIADYYLKKFNKESSVIRYGARVEHVPAGGKLAEFELKTRGYILYVSRLEPENNALGVIEAYSKLKTDLPLVVVGDAPYAEEYKQELRSAAKGSKVIFTGFQFGEAYQELRSNCLIYIQATQVGGTHPALVEALAYGNCIVANDVPEHREVLEEAGLYYDFNNFEQLSEIINSLLQTPEKIEELSRGATLRARDAFSWSRIASQYEQLFFNLVA